MRAHADPPRHRSENDQAAANRIYIYSARAPVLTLDTRLSGPLLRPLCHHAHMLANLSVSREGELPQITVFLCPVSIVKLHYF